MVKLEEDEDFDDYEELDEEKPILPQVYDYKSRRILVWIEDKENQPQVEETLAFLLPFATIRYVNSEEKATELSEKEEWDTYVVDLMEEGVSISEFVKTANNNLEIMLVALNYSRLNRDNEQSEMYFEPIRKLFVLDNLNANQTESPQ
jgi:hypothetical protein